MYLRRLLSEEQTEEEIIAIDEPSNKKLRKDDGDEDDKISLSSEEIEPSVEISDDSDEDMVIEVTETSKIVENGIESEVEVNDQLDNSNKDTVVSQVETDEVVDNKNTDKETVSDIEIKDNVPIHEAPTQLPLDISSDAIEEIISPEISYDFSNKRDEKVLILEQNDDEKLPSTNETDDVQITCGQIAQNSQEENRSSGTDNKEPEVVECNDDDKISLKEGSITNGDVQNDEIIQNGDVSKDNNDDVDSANDSKVIKNVITVEDMLADFVDEVNDEPVET